ncbi:MAG: cation-translocating P-type ATPase [Promethearchaeota archaeon]
MKRNHGGKLMGKSVEKVKGKDFSHFSFLDSSVVLEEFTVKQDTGLNQEEVERRREKSGLNVLPEVKPSTWKLYFAPFLENKLILVFLVAGAILLALSQMLHETGVNSLTFFIVLINALVAVVQQLRAQKSLNSLKELTKQACIVIREGERVRIDARSVVPGDILYLREGDRVPADARIVESAEFYVDESCFTGECNPVKKNSNKLENRCGSIFMSRNYVFMGTHVIRGTALAISTHTGEHTELGRISSRLNQLVTREVPLKDKVNTFANYLALLLCIMFSIGFIVRLIDPTDDAIHDLFDSLVLAIQFLPVNLVVLIVVILFTGVLILGKRGVIVRDITALETLGRISVVCTDKTGTLTKNEMTATRVYIGEHVIEVTGNGYESFGELLHDGAPVGKDMEGSLRILAESSLGCVNARIKEQVLKIGRNKSMIKMQSLGDPMDAALVALAAKIGLSMAEYRSTFRKEKEFPFSSELMRMAVVWKEPGESGFIARVKGAPELIIERCSRRLSLKNSTPVPLGREGKERLLSAMKDENSRGFRALAVAFRNVEDPLASRDSIESNLVLAGLVFFTDPPRADAREAVRSCKSAGIDVIMVTGDHPSTAENIANQLDISSGTCHAVRGDEISRLPDDTFTDTRVFARVGPDDKALIVKRLQEANKVAGMTGDGVNDALALGLADVGIAMGSGTDVAKDASDIIVTDDSFATIVRGIKNGRGLFEKIRNVVYFFIYSNIVEAAFIFFALLFTPGQNVIEVPQLWYLIAMGHAVPSLILTFDRPSKGIMNEGPRNKEELFNKNVLVMMGIHMLLLLLAMLPIAPMIYSASTPAGIRRAQSILITVMFTVEISTMLSIRRKNVPFWKNFEKGERNPLLILFLLVSIGGYAGQLAFPFIQSFFQLDFLGAADWVLSITVGLVPLIALELFKWFMRIKMRVTF